MIDYHCFCLMYLTWLASAGPYHVLDLPTDFGPDPVHSGPLNADAQIL